jgi:hypothetical protein
MIKIASWNMQGGGYDTDTNKTDVMNRFFNGGFDVICIQEGTEALPRFSEPVTGAMAGTVFRQPPSESVRIPRAGNAHESSRPYVCYVHKWGNRNTRCSLVVYVKHGLCSTGVDYDVIQAPDPDMRPMFWVKIPAMNFIIGDVHLPSGACPLAFKHFIHFRNTLRTKAAGRPYAIIGDFNMDIAWIRDKCESTGEDETHFHSNNLPTQQGGNTLDYVYYEGTDVHFQPYPDPNASDHTPIILTLE